MAATQFTANSDLPPGLWRQGSSRFPNPLTPLFAEYRMLDILNQGIRRAFDSASLPLPGPMNITIDGYSYGGPNAEADTSPERVAAFEAYVAEGREVRLADEWEQEGKHQAERLLRALQGVEPSLLTPDQLRAHVETVLQACRDTMAAHHTNSLGYFVEVGRLGLFCEKELGMKPAEVTGLLSGASPATSEPAAELVVLAAKVSSNAALQAVLMQESPVVAPEIAALLQPWIEKFGYRTTAFEYDQPTLVESPEVLVKLLRDAVEHPSPRPEKRAAAITEVPEAASQTFQRLLVSARKAYATRDDDVSFLQWAQGLQRLAFMEVGRRLTEARTIAQPEDVWYLRRSEMEQFLRDGELAVRTTEVAARKAERERQRAARPAAVLGTPNPFTPPPLSTAARQWLAARTWASAAMDSDFTADGGESEVRGLAGSPGSYTGRACVVLSESEFDKLLPGDVLICKMTTPSWNVVFATVGALVTDFGGLLSHPAIIAREFGIPAVVGTSRATTTIEDGMTVEVDGSNGVVRW